MPTFAAIDIGSNSCRLKIASVTQHHLNTLYEDREVTRLGESVFQMGEISPEAMAGTIKALRRFHKAVQEHVVDKVRVVATSAMRDARNSAAFTEWVRSATGWNVEVISGLEEGRLIHLGVVSHQPGAKGKCLLIDLGGGSCEVTLSDGGTVKSMLSLPLGAVRLQQEFLQQDPPAKEDISRLKQYIDRELKRVERKLGQPRVSLVVATSGTAAALAEASLAMATKSKLPVRKTQPKGFSRLDPNEAETGAVRKLADKLMKMDNAARAAVPGIGPRRSEIICGGALVFAGLLERLGLKGFATLRWVCETAYWRSCWPRSICARQFTRRSRPNDGQACWRSAADMESISARLSPSGCMSCSSSMRWLRCTSCHRSIGCGLPPPR